MAETAEYTEKQINYGKRFANADFQTKSIVDALSLIHIYTSGYNATDPKIKLKIDHTYRVAELCELITRDLKLDEYETDVAWLTGCLLYTSRCV